jgi:serine/threonine-protein kinase
MGAVWRAEHIDLGTPAAVKLIDETFAQSPEALTRFRREAQAAASLRSANVVQILDYGIDDGTPYIAMELLDGESLADRLTREGRLEPTRCAEIMLQVSKALSRAHDAGIVHRDLKPDNIFLVRDDVDEIAKVLDFGIAKRTNDLQNTSDMATRTGSLMGTPYYMSPEQASGRRQVDQRTDIWAYAVIAYECLTGQRPFDDANLGGLLLAICTETPVPASQLVPLPPAFDAWFARCTVKDPGGRYETIRDAAAELCRAIGIVMPASRVHMTSQPDGTLPHPHAQSAWGVSRGGASAVTPPGVMMSATGATLPTLIQKRRPPAILIASGVVGALGLLSVVAALAWRSGSTNPAPITPAAAASAPVVVAAPAAPPVPTPQLQVAPAPAAVDTPAPIQSAAPVVARPTEPPARARPAPVRPAARPAPGRAAEPAPTPRLRPQDRLERDLGF